MAKVVGQPGGRFGTTGGGGGPIPATPVISGAVDGGDNDSVVVSITGTDTIRLFYRILAAPPWTTGLTRSGSGDITQTGLTPGQWYEFYCVADNGTNQSAPSNIVTVLVVPVVQTIETAIYALLTADLTLTALVGTRITPVIVPQRSAMPAVTFAQVAGARTHSVDGPTGQVNSRWQFNCWASNTRSPRAVADALRQAIDGYSGTTGGVIFQSIQSQTENDIDANPAGVNVSRRYGKSQDFEIWFLETP